MGRAQPAGGLGEARRFPARSTPLYPVFVVGAAMSVRPSACAFAMASSAVIGASAGRGRLASELKSWADGGA